MAELPDKVHLVGSVNLDTAADVFRTCGKILGRRLRRIPDGETGPRRVWLMWQHPMFVSHPALEADHVDVTPGAFAWPVYRLAHGVNPEDLHFGALGYAQEAKASYMDFLAARQAGELAPSIKFQVCLPTPYAVVVAFCRGRDFLAIETAYTQAMLRELATICASIPHQDLVIQWDVCFEMLAWDGQSERAAAPDLQDVESELVARMKRLCEAVPGDTDAGVHLCYGDANGKHSVEPRDASKEVAFANAIANSVTRPLTFLHMPVPINRFDEEFYRPLADLKLKPETEFYLGLVHPDGKENMRKRLELANKYISGYGIASECGISRARTRELTMKFLQAYADNSREP
jgi:hypothetical protein